MDQRSRTSGHTAVTTRNQADEALRRAQGRPAPIAKPRPQTVAA